MSGVEEEDENAKNVGGEKRQRPAKHINRSVKIDAELQQQQRDKQLSTNCFLGIEEKGSIGGVSIELCEL